MPIKKRKPNPAAFKKGNPGRPKGIPNKFTNLKAAFIGAFQDIGGQEALAKFAKGKHKKAFYHMVASMLPKDIQLSGADGKPLPSQTPVIVFCDGDGKASGLSPESSDAPKTEEASKGTNLPENRAVDGSNPI